jgi:hypothetical protein
MDICRSCDNWNPEGTVFCLRGGMHPIKARLIRQGLNRRLYAVASDSPWRIDGACCEWKQRSPLGEPDVAPFCLCLNFSVATARSCEMFWPNPSLLIDDHCKEHRRPTV